MEDAVIQMQQTVVYHWNSFVAAHMHAESYVHGNDVCTPKQLQERCAGWVCTNVFFFVTSESGCVRAVVLKDVLM